MKQRRITLLLTLALAILMALPMPALAAAKKDWHALNAKDQTAVMETLQAQPQYAGCYWENGTLHILSTRPAALRKTVQTLGERYDLAIAVDQKAARYTYDQLASGYEKLSDAMKELDVWSVGLNEKVNRLELLSEKTWSSMRKREAAKAAGLPQGALRFLKERQPSLPDVVEVVAPPVNAPDNNAGGTQMEADRDLNVRSGPGTKYAIVGELNKGNVVTYLGKSGSWAKIRYAAGSTGYVYAAYLDPYTGSGSYETGTSFEGTHTATANVNVRSGPGTNHTRLGSIQKGELVTAIGTSGSWTKIQWYTGEAYVSSAYLKANAAAAKKNYDNLYFALIDGYLRASESRNGRAAGEFERDSWLQNALSVTKKGWLHLQFEVLDHGKTHIKNAYIAPGEFGKLPKGFVAASGARYVREDMAALYRDAQDDRYPNQWITKGAMVTVLAKKGDWVLVDYGEGSEIRIGYMKAKALSNA